MLEPAIRRARLDTLHIYEISEAELDVLERGQPDALFLNLAIAVLSVAVSCSATLATTTIPSRVTQDAFIIVTVVGYLAGATFGLLWWRSHRAVESVTQRIRNRMPPEGVAADAGGGIQPREI